MAHFPGSFFSLVVSQPDKVADAAIAQLSFAAVLSSRSSLYQHPAPVSGKAVMSVDPRLPVGPCIELESLGSEPVAIYDPHNGKAARTTWNIIWKRG